MVSRRRFLEGSAALLGAAGMASIAEGRQLPISVQAAELLSGEPTLPAIELIALNRMGYGPRPGDLERLRSLGFAAYVAEQLNPDDSQDTLFNQKLAATKLRIEYGPYPNRIREDLSFTWLDATLDQLWPLADYNQSLDGAQRNRPLDEVIHATWLRAVYSKWQLRELMVEFWHNHFNVYCYTNQEVQSTWPLYDKIMRRYCLGNFRQFLEAIAKSIAMQYYLNNASNTSAGPNENYARELFELHTLGAINYFNTLYKDWKAVPGATQTPPAPIGYIDEDVYEAARALTGWTIEDGSYHGGIRLPDTGKFTFNESAKDRFQKRVLATDMPPNLTAEDYGTRVLDLVAKHPGTAKFICTKLCRRLVADNPPASLVDKAVATWSANLTAPDQIKKVLQTILLSDEFKSTWGQKVKRPFELYVSFIRASGVDFPSGGVFKTDLAYGFMEAAGQRTFNWRPPTGFPDTATYWLSTSVTLRRWNGLNRLLAEDFWGLGQTDPAPFPIRSLTPATRTTSSQIVDYWVDRLLGRSIAPALRDELIRFLSQGRGANVAPTGDPGDLDDRFGLLVALIGMLPDFQWK